MLLLSIMKRFANAFLRIADDLRLASGLNLIWKDADPTQWRHLDPRISQHLQPYCLAIKRATDRQQQCIAHDALALTAWSHAQTIIIRACPFGISEATVAISNAGVYQGACLIGPWRSPHTQPAFAHAHWQRLPALNVPRAQATARLVESLVTAIIHLRDPQEHSIDARVAAARIYIDGHASAELRAAEVAAEVGLSTSRLIHLFSAFGPPFRSWLRRCLMRRAAILLSDPSRTVTAIARDLGYANLSAFTAAFRAEHGQAPALWRRHLGRVKA